MKLLFLRGKKKKEGLFSVAQKMNIFNVEGLSKNYSIICYPGNTTGMLMTKN